MRSPSDRRGVIRRLRPIRASLHPLGRQAIHLLGRGPDHSRVLETNTKSGLITPQYFTPLELHMGAIVLTSDFPETLHLVSQPGPGHYRSDQPRKDVTHSHKQSNTYIIFVNLKQELFFQVKHIQYYFSGRVFLCSHGI